MEKVMHIKFGHEEEVNTDIELSWEHVYIVAQGGGKYIQCEWECCFFTVNYTIFCCVESIT